MRDERIKVIRKDDQKEQRIRPEVMKKLLLDEKSKLVKRVKEIDRRLQTA